MSFYNGDLATQKPMSISAVPQNTISESSIVDGKAVNESINSSASGKREIESHPFVNQFSEVEKAISNFTKHQPFNHHYAPNVHPNRNHNNNHGNHYNRFNNNNNNNMGNGRFHQQQQQQPMLQQHFKTPQQQIPVQQYMNSNGLQSRSVKLPMGYQQQQQQQQQQQPVQLQQSQQQPTSFQQQYQVQQQQQQQQQQAVQAQSQQQHFMNNDLKFDMFQQTSREFSLPLRNSSSPTFNVPMRPSSVNSSFPMNSSSSSGPLEQINTGSSMGLGGSDLISTPVSNPIMGGVHVDQKISLDDSTTTYLGDLWGNSKNLRSSASVWA